MNKNIDEIFEREDERKTGMQEMLVDYLETIDNSEVPETYNVKKWAAAELIMFLAYYVGDTHYEMVGILDECKDDLRKRHQFIMNENNNTDEDDE